MYVCMYVCMYALWALKCRPPSTHIHIHPCEDGTCNFTEMRPNRLQNAHKSYNERICRVRLRHLSKQKTNEKCKQIYHNKRYNSKISAANLMVSVIPRLAAQCIGSYLALAGSTHLRAQAYAQGKKNYSYSR